MQTKQIEAGTKVFSWLGEFGRVAIISRDGTVAVVAWEGRAGKYGEPKRVAREAMSTLKAV